MGFSFSVRQYKSFIISFLLFQDWGLLGSCLCTRGVILNTLTKWEIDSPSNIFSLQTVASRLSSLPISRRTFYFVRQILFPEFFCFVEHISLTDDRADLDSQMFEHFITNTSVESKVVWSIYRRRQNIRWADNQNCSTAQIWNLYRCARNRRCAGAKSIAPPLQTKRLGRFGSNFAWRPLWGI